MESQENQQKQRKAVDMNAGSHRPDGMGAMMRIVLRRRVRLAGFGKLVDTIGALASRVSGVKGEGTQY